MSIVHEHDARGRYLVNTGIEILGVIPKLEDSSVYRGRLGNIVKRINIQDMIDPYILTMYKLSRSFLCIIKRNSLHPPQHYCILIITILRGNRLMYQLYHNFIRNSISSWYLAYEEVVPADTGLPPAASVSFGLSTLNINGVATIN